MQLRVVGDCFLEHRTLLCWRHKLACVSVTKIGKENMSDTNSPRPEDIQKEFEDFVQKKFGQSVKIIAQEFPFQNLANRAGKAQSASESDELEDKKKNYVVRFDMKPEEVKAHLDRFVIDQDDAKKALSIAVCDHYNQVAAHIKNPDDKVVENYAKQNVLVLGATGVGKTYMVRQVAKLIGVPFVKADATRFSETGYIGSNVDDLIKDLVNQANGDINKAQYGIIYLDEVDKLAANGQLVGGRDISGRGVQMGLLKIMEETEVDLRAGNDPASQIQAFMEMQQKGKVDRHVINTRHILFIVSGAFTGLDDITAKRLNRKSIGFQSEDCTNDPQRLLRQASTQDFIDFGFEPEFVGRLPVRVACHELDEKQLFSILKNSEGSIIRQYEGAFKAYGISAVFEDGALRAIAKRAELEKTGARGLMTILEQALREFKFYLPSLAISELVVDEQMIENPEESLAELLRRFPKPRPSEGQASTPPSEPGDSSARADDSDVIFL